LKFSPNVLFKDVPKINIVAIKGFNTSSDINESNFNLEYNLENNELIITNAFGDLGETEFIFENKSANALVDQEILFTLIPIKQIFTDYENSLFSVEMKMEGESSEKKV